MRSMAASLGLNREAEAFFNPCSAYSASSPFTTASDYTASFPTSEPVDGTAFFAELDDDRRLFDFEYSPAAASIFAGNAGDRDDDNEKMRYAGDEKGARVNGRIGFRTRSEVEILDDGFKWRKYGKKAVKNSPNPRNYYRCSADGCGVKKRVERDRDDPRYVITTYDGVHNHASLAAAIVQYGGDAGAQGFYSSPNSGSPPAAASY